MSAIAGMKARFRGEARLLLGTATIIVLAALLAIAATGGFTVFSTSDDTTVRAVFERTAQLEPGDPVRIDGVEVGRVESVSSDGGSGAAMVEMTVDRSAGDLHANAGAAIKWRTLLGGTFAVDLERGRPDAGALSGSAIPSDRTTTQVEVEDLTSLVRGEAGGGLRSMMRELARAFREPKQPARILSTLDENAWSLEHGLAAARGQRPDRDVRRLVLAAARTVRAIDTPTDRIRDVVSGAAATVEVTAGRERELAEAIARSPDIMRLTRNTLDRLDTTLGYADPLIARLLDSASDVGPTLEELRPTLVGAQRLLNRAVPLLHSLRPAASALGVAARRSLPVVDGLAQSLRRVDRTILPFLSEIDPQTGRSATQMIGPTFSHMGGGTNGTFDTNGHLQRFPISASEASLQTLPCRTALTNPDEQELLVCKSIEEALGDFLSYDPLGATADRPPPSADGVGR